MGFTVVEMIVTIIVLSLFVTMFFQMFIVSDSRRVNVTRRSAADDISRSNLRKITTKATLEAVGGADCDVTIGTSNVNNLQENPNAAGSTIAWLPGTFDSEVTTGTILPSDTTQTLVVKYPQGCDPDMPAQILSSVTFNGGSGTERVVHVAYINN